MIRQIGNKFANYDILYYEGGMPLTLADNVKSENTIKLK